MTSRNLRTAAITVPGQAAGQQSCVVTLPQEPQAGVLLKRSRVAIVVHDERLPADEGLTFREIPGALAAQQHLTSRGKPYAVSAIQSMLEAR